MKKPFSWALYGTAYRLRKSSPGLKKAIPMCRRKVCKNPEASEMLKHMIEGDKPFLAGRMGLFETAAVRAWLFGRKKNYELVMKNIYDCAGFFPQDTAYLEPFAECMLSCMKATDLYVANNEPMEAYLIDKYVPESSAVALGFRFFEMYDPEIVWSEGLKGKKVLVVTPFTDSVESQYARREEIYKGSEKLPQFELKTYRSLMTIGDMKDERFEDWFAALDYMAGEILKEDFEVALIGCGAYSYPLGLRIKEAGRQAVCVGGILQILFGILGRRWDGSRYGGPEHMPEKLKPWVSDSWIYPLEERPAAADNVEYGPYWK